MEKLRGKRSIGIWNYLLITLVLLVIYSGQKFMGFEIVGRSLDKTLDKREEVSGRRGIFSGDAGFGSLQGKVLILQAEIEDGGLGEVQTVVNKYLISKAAGLKGDKEKVKKWKEYYERRDELILGDIKL